MTAPRAGRRATAPRRSTGPTTTPATPPPRPEEAIRAERLIEIQDQLEAIERVPEAERTASDRTLQQELAAELSQIGLSHVEQPPRWMKLQELSITTVTLLELEVHVDELSSTAREERFQRAYRVSKGGTEWLIGELWGLRALARYPSGSRVTIRSLGKVPLSTEQHVHKFEISPPPASRVDILPTGYDCRVERK